MIVEWEYITLDKSEFLRYGQQKRAPTLVEALKTICITCAFVRFVHFNYPVGYIFVHYPILFFSIPWVRIASEGTTTHDIPKGENKMTKKQIKEYYNTHFNDTNDRIVDIDIFDAYSTFANIITISRNHVVWKTSFEIENGKMIYLDSKCFA